MTGWSAQITLGSVYSDVSSDRTALSESQDPGELRAPKRFRVPALSVFQIRDYRFVWGSTTLGNTCLFMDMVVVALLVLERTDSAFWVALVGGVRFLPWLLFGVFSGLIADRLNRWIVIVTARVITVLVVTLVLVLVVTDRVEPWHLIFTSLALGWAIVLEIPSRSWFIQDLVGSQNLVRAMSLDTITFTIGSILGPLFAGLFLEITDFKWAYIFLLTVYLLSLAGFLQVKGRQARPSTRTQPVVQHLISGLRYAMENGTIRGVLLITLIMNLLSFGALQLFPVVARDHLNVGPGLTGVLISANGIGTFIGATAVVYRGITRYHGRVFAGGSSLQLVALLLFALSPWYPLSFFLLLLVGLGLAGFATMQYTITLLASTPERRGAALGAVAQCIGMGPLGTFGMGALATILNPQWSIGITAVAGLLLMLPVIILTPIISRPTVMGGEGAGQPGDISATGPITNPPMDDGNEAPPP